MSDQEEDEEIVSESSSQEADEFVEQGLAKTE
jgi:hypothetical protein